MKKFITFPLGLILIGLLGQLASDHYIRKVSNFPGTLVQTSGAKVHLYCTGHKSAPLVVLEAGAIGWSQTWGWVQPELSDEYRVCSYDRPGLGWSQTNLMNDADAAVTALHEALTHVGEDLSDVTLVGHSYGAIVARSFAAKYPNDVDRLIFVDGSHPDQFKLLPETFVNKARKFNELLKPLGYISHLGIIRLLNPLGALADGLPEYSKLDVRYFGSDPTHLLTAYREMQLWDQSAQLAKVADLKSTPLLIISAAQMKDATATEYEAWLHLHRSMLALSKFSKHSIIPESDHYSLLMNREHASVLSLQISRFISETRNIRRSLSVP